MMENEYGRIDLLTQAQIDWCNEHIYLFKDEYWFVDDEGKINSSKKSIGFKNKHEIIKFPVQFADCEFFSCYDCYLLESLEGCPKRITKTFMECSRCEKLKDLLGSPESVANDFSCDDCSSLISLEGIPKSIGRDLMITGCDMLKNLEPLRNIFIGRNIICSEKANSSLKKEWIKILRNKKIFKMWQRSNVTMDEFSKKYDGFIQAENYGI